MSLLILGPSVSRAVLVPGDAIMTSTATGCETFQLNGVNVMLGTTVAQQFIFSGIVTLLLGAVLRDTLKLSIA